MLTGPPGCGKTTLIKQIAEQMASDAAGFYTEEIRKDGKRDGFRIEFLNGSSGVLARKGLKSKHKVGSYGVDLEEFESLIDKEILNIMKSPCVIIDEIGKMELFSHKFREIIGELLNSNQTLLGTIIYKAHPFADSIKAREDVMLIKMDRNAFQDAKNKILNILKLI
jgi:nucleoside-triphosphatase